jgi:hypothetical protein
MKDAMVCQNDEKAERPKALETRSAKKLALLSEQLRAIWLRLDQLL